MRRATTHHPSNSSSESCRSCGSCTSSGSWRLQTSDDPRAVSDLIGFVLVFSLIVATVGIVTVAGLNALESTRDIEQTNNAERGMEVLADNMADLDQRGAPSRATEISLKDASMRLGDEVLVIVRDHRDVNASDSTFLTSRVFQLRPIIYDDGDTELVYVMGAVFRDDPHGGTVIKPYSPVLGPDRTLIPVVRTVSATGGTQHIQSSTVLVRGNVVDREVPVADTDSNVDYHDVWINVSSPRQTLWNRTLSENAELSCSTNDPDWVNCSLDHPPDRLFVTEVQIAVELSK